MKVEVPEQNYAKRNMLYVQMEFLTSLKRLKAYKALREVETDLKVMLKKKLDEISDELKVLDKLLPKEKDHSLPDAEKATRKKREDFELEIQEIRRKIERLQ